jgi:hypothetical protein
MTSPMPRKPSSRKRITTDYVTDKRHQFSRTSVEAALLESETLDTRIRPDISLKGYLAHFGHYIPDVFTIQGRKNHINSLRHVVPFLPDVTLAETDETHIDVIMTNVIKTGLSKRTGEHYITSVGVALRHAILENRITGNAVERFFAKPENRRRQPAPELDLPDPKKYPSIEASLPKWSLPGFRSITAAGLHATEAVALERNHIRPEHRAIGIVQHVRGGRVVKPDTVSLIRTVQGVDETSLEIMLDAARVPGGDDFLLQKEGWPGKPWARATLYNHFSSAIRNAQLEAGVVSLETGEPFKPVDFRNRWIVTRLTERPEEWLHTMVQAGYANVGHFTRTYNDYLIDPESHEQMELALEALESLSRISDYQPSQV